MADPRFADERRRLAGMLPGAEIGLAADAARANGVEPAIEVVALVNDLDAPIAVLVERGGYAIPAASEADGRRHRLLRRGAFRLVLTDDPDDFARRTTGAGTSGGSA